jgi:hypothetical protein
MIHKGDVNKTGVVRQFFHKLFTVLLLEGAITEWNGDIVPDSFFGTYHV